MSIFKRQSARNRLWQIGGIVALAVLAIVITNQFLPQSKAIERSSLGLDFVPFYSAGQIFLEGQFNRLYDFEQLERYQAQYIWPELPEAKPMLGPWWNPPHYALWMSTFSRLPFADALRAWTMFGATCMVVTVWLLARHVRRTTGEDAKSWMLVPLLVLVSYPCIQALGHGQNTPLSLLLLTLTALAWHARRGMLAGVLCGLMAYKPQLSALVGLMLVLSLGKRPLIGMLIVGLITAWSSEFAMPGMISRFVEMTPINLPRVMQADDYLWHRHATILALIRLAAVDPNAQIVEVIAFVGRAVVFIVLLITMWESRIAQSKRMDRIIALTIMATPLLMPFYFDYDLLLLAVAGVMLGVSMRVEPVSTPFDRSILIGGMLWYVTVFFNSMFASSSRINVGTVLLFGLFLLVTQRNLWLWRAEATVSRLPLIART